MIGAASRTVGMATKHHTRANLAHSLCYQAGDPRSDPEGDHRPPEQATSHLPSNGGI